MQQCSLIAARRVPNLQAFRSRELATANMQRFTQEQALETACCAELSMRLQVDAASGCKTLASAERVGFSLALGLTAG